MKPAAPLVGLVLLALSAAVTGHLYGLPLALLVLLGGVIAVALALGWASVTRISGESEMTLDEALSLAAPSATEEQKRAVLRSLKDLEYELSVGKISQEDFESASAEYRSEAKRLIALSDEALEARRARAEERLRARLETADAGPPPEAEEAHP